MKRKQEGFDNQNPQKRITLDTEKLYKEAFILKQTNPKEAFSKFQSAANQGHVPSIFELAQCYSNGTGIAKNPEQAFIFHSLAAKHDHAEASYEAGMYIEKLYKVKDYKVRNGYQITPKTICGFYQNALYFSRNNNEQWCAESSWYKNTCFKFAQYNKDGFGTEKNEVQAYHYYLKAANSEFGLEAHFQAAFLSLKYFQTLYPKNTKQDVEKHVFETHYKRFDNTNHAPGLCALANCYYNGTGTDKDEEKAIRYYKESSRLGNYEAMFRLAEHYQRAGDYNLAFEHYYKVREIYISAAYNIACYIEKFYRAKDWAHPMSGHRICPESAYEFYKKAADKGHAWAKFHKARCMESGFGIGKDRSAAYAAYKILTEEGNLDARFRAGLLLLEGIGQITSDCKKEAFDKYFSFFKETEHGQGLWKVGKCYQSGTGTKKDPLDAFIYFKKSADLGFAPAQLEIFFCYRDGLGGVEKDEKLALSYCEKALAQNYIPAVYQTALNIISGLDKSHTKAEAISLLDKASHTTVEALTHLGDCYARGFGVETNEKQALEYYKAALVRKSPRAALELGLYYRREGYFTQAHHYFVLASDAGFEAAFFYLGESLKNGWGSSLMNKETLEQEIYNNFKKASALNHLEAMYHLGCCYEQGTGCDSDLEEEFKSAKPGSGPSKKALALKKAFELYEKSANQEDLGQTGFALGLCYMYGNGTGINREKAHELLLAAVKQGIDEAYFELGILYEKMNNQDKASECFLNYAQAIQEKRKLFLNHYEQQKQPSGKSQKPLLPVNKQDVFNALLIPAKNIFPNLEKNKPVSPEYEAELLFKTARMFCGVVQRKYDHKIPHHMLFPIIKSKTLGDIIGSVVSDEYKYIIDREYQENLVQPKKNALKAEIFLKEALKKNHPEAALRLGDFYSGLSFSLGEDLSPQDPDIDLAIQYYTQSEKQGNFVAKERLKDSNILLREAVMAEVLAMPKLKQSPEYLKEACEKYLKLIADLTSREQSLGMAERSNLSIAKSKVQKALHTLAKEYENKADEARGKKSDQFFSNPNEPIQLMDDAKKYYQIAADLGYEPSKKALSQMETSIYFTRG